MVALLHVLCCLSADLQSRRVERGVLVLERAHQHHVLEPLEALELRHLEQTALLRAAGIGHSQLGDRRRLLPLVQDPHAGGEQLARLVHVSEVGGAEGDVAVHLVLELVEVWQCCSDDEAAHGVANECQSGKLIARTVLSDILMNLLCKFISHVHYVSVCICFVCC